MSYSDKNKVREAVFAGQFYDANPVTLQKQFEQLDNALTTAGDVEPYRVGGVIIPHAGYMFSLSTAFKTLMKIKREAVKRVVLIAPSHRVAFRGIGLPAYSSMQTPLGNLKVDVEAVESLLNAEVEGCQINDEAHVFEHSLEVQLPLLKYFFGEVTVIPIVCGIMSELELQIYADLLTEFFVEDTLFVISSDFTHYGRDYDFVPFSDNIEEEIKKLDAKAIDYIIRRDRAEFIKYCRNEATTICGSNVIALFLAVLDFVNPEQDWWLGFLEDYTTSGAVTSDFTNCVSYAGITVRSGEHM